MGLLGIVTGDGRRLYLRVCHQISWVARGWSWRADLSVVREISLPPALAMETSAPENPGCDEPALGSGARESRCFSYGLD